MYDPTLQASKPIQLNITMVNTWSDVCYIEQLSVHWTWTSSEDIELRVLRKELLNAFFPPAMALEVIEY
jgi:hypothetical protein